MLLEQVRRRGAGKAYCARLRGACIVEGWLRACCAVARPLGKHVPPNDELRQGQTCCSLPSSRCVQQHPSVRGRLL